MISLTILIKWTRFPKIRSRKIGVRASIFYFRAVAEIVREEVYGYGHGNGGAPTGDDQRFSDDSGE